MAKTDAADAHNGGANHSPSLADRVGETLLGEVGFGPKAFYKESDQYLRDPNFLANNPEYWVMPGAAISQPLQMAWKAVDDTGHLIFDTGKDELTAVGDVGKAAIVDPITGVVDGAKGLGALVTGHPGEFVKDDFNGLKELTIDPLWDATKGLYNAVKPVGEVLSHPLHAGVDLLETGGRVAKDALSIPFNMFEGAADLALKAPGDLLTGNFSGAAHDVIDGVKHETIDPIKDAYKGVSHAVNGVAHAVFDLL